MKITTYYTPTDTDGNAFNLRDGVYTLSALQTLANGLAKAGVQADDALRFQVVPGTGELLVVVEKII